MQNISILKQFSRLMISSPTPVRVCNRNIFTALPLQFRITDQLLGEPLKKKKKMDPAIIRAREERRRKRLEKTIRKLQKNARQLKPIDEIEGFLQLKEEFNKRKRPNLQLSNEESDARAILQKEWARYKRVEYISHVAQIDRIMSAQKRALDKLYEESEELYDEAVALDLQLLPYTVSGPVATPPIKGYQTPDGEYIDVTKKWDN